MAVHENSIEELRVGGMAPRWQTGQVTNPTGPKPRDPVLQGYIDQKTGGGRKMVAALWAIALDEKHRVRDRIKAMEVLLERGFGKPVQQVEVDGQVNLTRELGSFSDQELMELVDLRKRLRGDEDNTVEGTAKLV